jgi:Ca2+-binding EF-hand superfamily protein
VPQPPLDDAAKAQAAEAKAKAIEAAKKDAQQLANAQDRIAERYKKEMKLKGVAVRPVVEKFPLIDSDKDGCIDRKEAESAPELMANFRALDADHDGRLCSGELREMATGNSKQGTAAASAKKK